MSTTKRSFKEIGKFIRMKRLNHPQSYSQNQLSKKLGYKNGQFISNVERGLCGIPLKGIRQLVETLDIDPATLKEVMIKDYENTLDNFLNDNAGEVTVKSHETQSPHASQRELMDL